MTTGTLNPTRFLQYENKRLLEENQTLQAEVKKLRRILTALSTLQEVSAHVNQQTDVLSLLDRLLQAALASVTAQDGSLLLVDHDTKELAFAVVHGEVRERLIGHRIPIGKGIAGWVAQHATPVMVANARLDTRFSPDVDHTFQFHTRSMLCVPIVYANQVIGVIQALNKANGEDFDPAELTLFGVVAQLVATALHKAETAVNGV